MRSSTFLSVSRLHIVAIAALGTLTFGWLFTGQRPFALAAVCALDWFLVNLANRVVDLPEDQANQITGTDFVARNRKALLIGTWVALLGSLVAVHLVLPALTPWRVAYHLLGVIYNWPLLPGRRRLKQLYAIKNIASATGFLLTVFCYPLASLGWDLSRLPAGITGATILLAAIFFFLFELSYEAIYDLRDAPGDAIAGVRTFAVVHGEAGAVRIIDTLLWCAVATLGLGSLAHLVPWRLLVMIAAPALQLVVYKSALRRGITSRDCIRLTWLGAALLGTYHVWILLELPGLQR